MNKFITTSALSCLIATSVAQEKIDTLDELVQQMTATGVGGIDVAKVIEATTQYSYSRTKEYPSYSVVVSKTSQDSSSISITCDSRKNENNCAVDEGALLKKMTQLGIKKTKENQSKLTTKDGIEISITHGEFGENLYSTNTFRQFIISYTYRKPQANTIKLW